MASGRRLTAWTTFAGAGALVERDGRVLMVRQRRHYGVHWELPSGYVEAGESFEQAAAREVLEETAVAVAVGDLLCTMVWERRHDRRRNVLAFFLATDVDPDAEPRPQSDEDIEDAGFIDPRAVDPAEMHPLNQAIFERWWESRTTGFHVHADVRVHARGTQSYVF
ncbi:MAG TPA: NUDIX hydrolase [Gaiellaceae bacterium]|nr:NUDIX hydrolase [Gaiellaceae bacterium]